MKKIILIISFIISGINILICQHINIPTYKFYQEIREKNISEKNRIKSSRIKQSISIENRSVNENIKTQKLYDNRGFLEGYTVWTNDSITHKYEYKFDSSGNELASTRFYSNDSIKSKSFSEFDSKGNQISNYSNANNNTERAITKKYNSKGKIVEISKYYSLDSSNTKEQFLYKNDTLLVNYIKRIELFPISRQSRGVYNSKNRIDTTFVTYNGITEEIHTFEYNNYRLIREVRREKYFMEYTKFSYSYENDIWKLKDTTLTIDTGRITRIISYEYDSLNKLVSETDSTLSGARSLGRKLWRIEKTMFRYDSSERLIEKSEYILTSNRNELKYIEISEYDENGNIICTKKNRAKFYRDSTYYTYDDYGNLINKKYFHSCGCLNGESNYSFNHKGSLIKEENYSLVDCEVTPDNCSDYRQQMLSDTSFLKKIIIFYNDSGKKKEELQYDNYGNLFRTFRYNIHDQIIQILEFNSKEEIIINSIFNYDYLGNPLDFKKFNKNDEVVWSKIFNYTYDDD